MKFSISSAQIALVIGANSYDIENWIKRVRFTTNFEPTLPGLPRQLSRENALELALFAMFVKYGAKTPLALAYTTDLLGRKKLPNWIYCDVTGVGAPVGASEMNASVLAKVIDVVRKSRPAAVMVAEISETVRRIDEEFGQAP